jgi:hypothetical protein
METLQDALIKQAIGDGSIVTINQDELTKATAAGHTAANPGGRKDTRQPGNLARELKILRLNHRASEDDRKEAEREVNNLTGVHAKLTKQLKEVRKLVGPAAADMVSRLEKQIEDCGDSLNNERTGAKEKLERHTRIADSRARLIEEFLSAKPYHGMPSNGDMIENDKKIQEALDAIREGDLSVSQPVVGVGIRRAE